MSHLKSERALRLVLFLLSLFSLPTGCSSSEQMRVVNNDDVLVQSGQTPPMPHKNESRERVETRETLNKLSQFYGLPNEPRSDAEIELRLWLYYGLKQPECIILVKSNGTWTGTQLRAETHKNGAKIVKSSITPKAGWNFLDETMLLRNIKNPVSNNLQRDLNDPIPDEGQVFIQLREGGYYDYVGYRAFTRDSNGKNALRFCTDLQKHLNISVDCIKGADDNE